jgi:hypothetical protein
VVPYTTPAHYIYIYILKKFFLASRELEMKMIDHGTLQYSTQYTTIKIGQIVNMSRGISILIEYTSE